MKSWEERLHYTTELLKSSSHQPAQLAEAAKSFYYKLVAADQYRTKAIFGGQVTLLSAKDNFVSLEKDYGLTAVSLLFITTAESFFVTSLPYLINDACNKNNDKSLSGRIIDNKNRGDVPWTIISMKPKMSPALTHSTANLRPAFVSTYTPNA